MNPIPEFSKLVDSLDALSTRWEGAFKARTRNYSNLAAKYARMLRRMHERCLENADFRIDVLGYANELGNDSNDISHASSIAPAVDGKDDEVDVAHSKGARNGQPLAKKKRSYAQVQERQDVVDGGQKIDRGRRMRSRKTKTGDVESSPPAQQIPTPLSTNLAPVQMPINEGPYTLMNAVEVPAVAGDGMLSDDFTYISQLFHDQQFLDRDRVISYDEGMFAASMDWLGNGNSSSEI